MDYILCLETSGTNCSVAVSHKQETLFVKEINTGNFSHAENLHVFIQDILTNNALSYSNIKAIAVSTGPGSYTGLRIGVATAKGLCFAWDIPFISVPTLEILAQNNIGESDFIIPLLDARRMEVYCAVFDQNKKQISPTQAKILDENSFSEYLQKGKVCFVGDGTEKFEKICNHHNAFFLRNQYPSATNMSSIAFERFQTQQFEDIAYFEPFYLKNFQSN